MVDLRTVEAHGCVTIGRDPWAPMLRARVIAPDSRLPAGVKRLPLICYIHVPGAITPHIRVLSDVTPEQAIQGLARTFEEWPDAARVELYDETDRAVVKYDCALRRRVHDA